MNPIDFALRRPVTIIAVMAGLVLAGALALDRMKVDIFPALNLPVVYVCQPYGGMDPQQMEGLIANFYEYHFLYINGIHHVESKNVQGISLMKLYFHPDTDMAQALAETVGYVNRSRAFMPPGTVPPFIMRFDTGSVPVGYLVLRSDTKTIGQIQDEALFKVRPMFASIPGVSAPPPFGGNQRTVVVRADPDRLRAYNVSADDVVRALTAGNTISPSGAIRTTDAMPLVPSNAMVIEPSELSKIPVRPGVYLGHVAPSIEDATDIPTGYALVNGRRAVYILVTKRANASTVDVVNRVRAELPRMQGVLPSDIKVSFEFDQSPYVTNAVRNVAVEGGLAAALVGLMVLVFLRDWRSVIVVVLNIPLALIGSVVALALTGQTINLMTLGGLALAVGILVDESTVEVENIHTQMEKTGSMALAVRRGNSETAVPRLLAMLCILAVFIPSFVMQGPVRALFVPLSLAVGFAMIASYLLSSTFVPIMSVWLLRKHHRDAAHTDTPAPSPTRQGELARRFSGLLGLTTRWRWTVVSAYLVLAGLFIVLAGGQLGREIFPPVDAGQFQFRLRAPAGTRIEQTEAITQEALEFIKKEVGPENVAISLGYVGVVPSSYPINGVYLWMGGPEESVMRVALKPGVARIEELKHRLREGLPGHLRQWVTRKWLAEGVAPDRVERRVKDLRLSFEPADIVNEVMSFGSPTPIEIQVSSKSLADNRTYAEKLRKQLASVRSLRDVQYGQSLDYPTVQVSIDRERAAESGVSAEEVARSLVAATSSSRFVVPNFWRDPKSGIGYQVQVEIPQTLMKSPKDVELVPVKPTRSEPPLEQAPGISGRGLRGAGVSGDRRGQMPLLLRDVARVREGIMPGELDRYNMRRLVSMTANIEGEDLGRVAEHMSRAVAEVNRSLWTQVKGPDGKPVTGPNGKPAWKNEMNKEDIAYQDANPARPPKGMMVDVRGQVVPMQEMFRGLAFGLGLAVVVIFLLLTAYFQSPRLALTAVAAVPAVLCGVVLMLLLTRTTLNLQSFMGTIMAVGVAVANAILLVTFADRAHREGRTATEAGIEGARSRVRAILMTSLAMTIGMVPMALGFGEGGDQTAPLGRAVIGGLLASTVATLLILPAVFAILTTLFTWILDLILGPDRPRSVSLSPYDPESPHYVGNPEQPDTRITHA
jgi:multidrug efflux pump subunit AcrB